MLKVLIVDDTQEKVKEIRKALEGYVDNPDEVMLKVCTSDALRECAKTRYDLVILDLFIPDKAGNAPDPVNAQNFLKIIKNEPDEYISPVFIIGITKIEDIGDYEDVFTSETLTILNYSENSDMWKTQLKNRLDYLNGIKKKLSLCYEYDYDVAIINALQTPEHEMMMMVFPNPWEEIKLEDDKTTTYYTTVITNSKGKNIRCISCHGNQMGSVASAALVSKLILRFHPRYLFMTGISAAVRNDKVGYGDILVASEVWDGMSGKFTETEIGEGIIEYDFLPDYRQITLDEAMVNIINRLKVRKDVLAKIKGNYMGEGSDTELKIHMGPMASVSAVISSEQKIEEIKKHSRKLMGLEMESYGMFYAAKYAHALSPVFTVSIKSVSDMGDKDKGDKYQRYASYTSAALALYIIQNELDF